MRTIPAILAFFLVYYAMWLVSLPLKIIHRFIALLAGDDQ